MPRQGPASLTGDAHERAALVSTLIASSREVVDALSEAEVPVWMATGMYDAEHYGRVAATCRHEALRLLACAQTAERLARP